MTRASIIEAYLRGEDVNQLELAHSLAQEAIDQWLATGRIIQVGETATSKPIYRKVAGHAQVVIDEAVATGHLDLIQLDGMANYRIAAGHALDDGCLAEIERRRRRRP